MAAVQYLESLDPVRTGPGSGVSAEDARTAELQTFLEVLRALALGREIVVPQSFAFDSRAFLRVAHRVLNARPKESTDRPFRPHLFGEGISDFDDAVRSMLLRVHDPVRPFHSSLYPSLRGLTRGEIERVLEDLDTRLVRVTGDEYVDALGAVLAEFRRTTPYEVPTPGAGLRLDTALRELVDPRSTLSFHAEGLLGAQRDTYHRLRSAVRLLDPTRPAAFSQRSGLRLDQPWPNDPQQRTAKAIVGDDLPLVVEFVDTLYNRVIADSMGRPLTLYSTAPTADDALLEARYLAQELALGRPPLIAADEETEMPPFFQVVQRTHDSGPDERLGRDLDAMLDQGSEALQPLMGARSRRSDRFWRTLGDVQDAVAARDPSAYDKAMDRHLAYVGKLLVGQVDIGWRAEAGIFLAVQAGKQSAEATEPPGVPSWALDTALWAVERTSTKAFKAAGKRRARRRISSALGSVVLPALPRQTR
jgi:hypothetical protein